MTARRLIVEADGGSRGNPGVAGYGALVRDGASGEVLAERAEPLGTASNNVAEYTGLIAGLAEAQLIDERAGIEVRMDSKLVVEQMSGRWKIKHEDMKRLAGQARDIVKAIERAGGVVAYRWIPRERNKAADALSNDAMDGKSITRRPWQRPADDEDVADGAASEPESAASEPENQEVEAAREGARAGSTARRPTSARAAAPPQPSGAATRVVLVRHGVTAAHREGRLCGRGDGTSAGADLDGEGQRQARAVAAALRGFLGDPAGGEAPPRVVSSTLTRAHRTGQVVAAAFEVACEQDRAWDEQDYGDLEGRRIADLVASDGELLARLRRDPDAACPGGESYADLRERVVSAYERQVGAGGTVVVATHRMAILAVLAHVLGADLEHVWRIAVAPASMTSIRTWRDGAVTVEFVNDTSHLRS